MVLKLMMKNYEVLDFSVKGNNIKNIDKIISEINTNISYANE